MRAVAALALMAFGAASAQTPGVVTTGPAGNPLTEGTPRFVIATSGFSASQQPLQLRLQVSLSAEFAGPFWADTTVSGSSATIVIPRLLPQNVLVYWRTIARTAQGSLVTENATGPRQTKDWVTLVSPNNVNGNTLDVLRPTFSWTAVRLLAPIGPWRFTLQVRRKSDGFIERSHIVPDAAFNTSFTLVDDLEGNTPYYWTLSAAATTGDSVHVTSSSFVIASPNAPIATVLFQPFPNPFPNDRLPATCIWFDLRAQAEVKLDVLDLRGNHVKRIFPASGSRTLTPGRWGRDVVGGDRGCDAQFQWNGTDDAGRTVRPGVYLVQFIGDGVKTTKRVLFRGR